MEKTVESKTCTHCGISFDVTDRDLEFYDKISPVFADVKYPIPSPTLCPDCRQQRRLSFRNERKLYKRKCDLTGKDIISIFSPDKPYKVYEQSEWWSDKWDPMGYTRDFDFSRSFFEQFGELDNLVPKRSIINDNGSGSENCEYTNDFANGKDCYYCFEMGECRESLYSHHCNGGAQILDSDETFDSEDCYECMDSVKLYNCKYLSESSDCTDCTLGFHLTNCQNCYACTNLSNKSYCILDKQYTKDEYHNLLSNKENRKTFAQEYKTLLKNSIRKEAHGVGSENCYGYGISYSSNVLGYNIIRSKDSKYCINSDSITSCYDLQCWKSELCYEGVTPDNGFNVCFSIWTWQSKYVFYSFDCHACENCFGCTGLRNKSYCILNKQYTKEEFEELVPKIIEHMRRTGEWGEFFPSSLSPFGYNETVAQEYFPLDKESAIQKGFNWSDYEAPFPKVEKIIPAAKLPDDIAKIPDDILNWAIECEVTGKPFRIIRQELEFYRKHNLPIPRRHPDQRHLDRMALRNPRKLFERKCDKCGVEMMTTYSPERPEIVYCESCYNKEVIG